MEPLDGLKERMKLFTTIFQVSVTICVGVAVSLISYVGKTYDFKVKSDELSQGTPAIFLHNPYPQPDAILWTQALLIAAFFVVGIVFVVEADKVNDQIFDIEETKRANENE